MKAWGRLIWVGLWAALPLMVSAHRKDNEEPALGAPEARISQSEIESGSLRLIDLRLAGLKIFASQFNHADGFGDGPVNASDTTSPGGRPMLQNNGTFLRINGLDAQSCLECHSIVSADSTPFVTGVGGAGGINSSAMFLPKSVDVSDSTGKGFASFDGRLINPVALFGLGGVQLVAEEMTTTLQGLRRFAIQHPGQIVKLHAKGVDFGSIEADAGGNLDTSKVEGIDPDLVVRPFGRKGEFATVRDFDIVALMFHLGMQPVEAVGRDVDGDGDGVVNEISKGEVSALEIFLTTQDSPRQLPLDRQAREGFNRFRKIGCARCHRSALQTRSSMLRYRLSSATDHGASASYYSVDLRRRPPHFPPNRKGGITVPLFSDLKRHDMGNALAETFQGTTRQRNREFITAKLWGVADTAPYLHDGRALTLKEAILMHGGEAKQARDAYAALSENEQSSLIAFLRSLRNPQSPDSDVLH